MTKLTKMEGRLLETLRKEDRALTRDELYKALLGYIPPIETRRIDVHVCHIRAALGKDVIVTVPGGYRAP